MPFLISKRKKNTRSRSIVLPLLTCASLGHASLNLSQIPLFLANSSIPNIVFMLDDSGSMDWEILTERHFDYCNYWGTAGCANSGERTDGFLHSMSGYPYDYLYNGNSNAYTWDTLSDDIAINSFDDYFSNGQGDWRVFSSRFNRTYFNPAQTFEPWISSLPDAVFTAARAHPIATESGYGIIRNLANSFYVVAEDSAGYAGGAPTSTNHRFGANGRIDAWDNYTLYQIQSGAIARWSVTYSKQSNDNVVRMVQSLTAITDTTQVRAIQDNFANWYQYHRRRSFVVNAAVGSLVTEMPNYRYSLGMINEGSMLLEAPADNSALDTHGTNLLNTLFAKDQQARGTPLRLGLERAGNYLRRDDNSAPVTESCQQNFSVLLTDGFWGGSAPSNVEIGDEDGDGHADTVADVAHYYYTEDLRPDLPDEVPTGSSLSRQHMSTFTVAFGVSGNLMDGDGDGWPEINGGAPAENSNWGNPLSWSDNAAKIDDLWHAAFNSRGLYTAAETPEQISSGLGDALAQVGKRGSAAAAIAVSSGRLSADNSLYQARFDSTDWTGDLLAFAFTLNGGVATDETWRADTVLDSSNFNFRTVITADSVGKAFRYNSLSSTYRGLLTAGMGELGASGDADAFGAELLNYLRGKRASAITAYNFRDRNSLLGDIIHSSPAYVGAPSQSAAPYDGSGYAAFRSSLSNRFPVIYVGANDGMLHAFNANTGAEILAFIPYSVVDELYYLADPDYNHRYYVDGPVTVRDACLGAANVCAWSSVLVAGLRSGGRGLFALDVTNPGNFSEGNANNIFLWEITETDNDDIGHIYGTPSIVKLQTGEWGVITGNGYNSNNGLAKLLIRNAATGAEIATLATNNATENGLSNPSVVDFDGDGLADAVYAGDLKGNLWKFDISDSNSANWGSAYSSSSGPIPLYAGGNGKPITTTPQIGRHPNATGYMVYFGTGKYLELVDNLTIGQTTQGFHGVWDQDSSAGLPVTDSQLLLQTVQSELLLYPEDTNNDGLRDSKDESMGFRLTSRNSICWSDCSGDSHRGWRLDLTFDGNNRGEKQITDAILRNNRVIFTTMQPSPDVCDSGGQSWLMELSAVDGSSLDEITFDVNNDGVFNEDDRDFENWTEEDVSELCSGRCPAPSGFLMAGVAAPPTIVSKGGVEYKLISKSDGTITTAGGSPGEGVVGRQSWRELINE